MEDNLLKKKYNKVPKPESPVRVMTDIWCHQCKMKKSEVICCDNFFKKNKQGRCNGKYCDSCMQRHYATSLEELRNLPEWTCFKCTQFCVCACCKRERGDNVPVKKRRRRKNMPSDLEDSPPSSPLRSEKKQKLEIASAKKILDPSPPPRPLEVRRLLSPEVELGRSQIDVLAETASQIIASALLEETNQPQFEHVQLPPLNLSCCPQSSTDDVCPHCKDSVSHLKRQVVDLQNELALLRDILKNSPTQQDGCNVSSHPSPSSTPTPSSPSSPHMEHRKDSYEEVEISSSSSFSEIAQFGNKGWVPLHGFNSLALMTRN